MVGPFPIPRTDDDLDGIDLVDLIDRLPEILGQSVWDAVKLLCTENTGPMLEKRYFNR